MLDNQLAATGFVCILCKTPTKQHIMTSIVWMGKTNNSWCDPYFNCVTCPAFLPLQSEDRRKGSSALIPEFISLTGDGEGYRLIDPCVHNNSRLNLPRRSSCHKRTTTDSLPRGLLSQWSNNFIWRLSAEILRIHYDFIVAKQWLISLLTHQRTPSARRATKAYINHK